MSDTFHRVILKDGKYLASEAVGPTGERDKSKSDLSGLRRVQDLKQASAWVFDRACTIARMFPDAIVDRIDSKSLPGVWDRDPRGK